MLRRTLELTHSLQLFYPLFTAKGIFLEQRWQFASEVKGVAYGARQEWGPGGRGCGEVVGVELGRALCRRDDRAVGLLAGVVGVYAARRSDNDRRQPAGRARDEVRLFCLLDDYFSARGITTAPQQPIAGLAAVLVEITSRLGAQWERPLSLSQPKLALASWAKAS